MRIDLHTHSSASDGTCPPAELVRIAAAEQIDVIALTDHDTLDGFEEATEAAATDGRVSVVAGIELSTDHEGQVHVLGVLVDPRSARLQGHVASMRRERYERAAQMVVKLARLGYQISLDEVLQQAGTGVIGRPHVARALVARGYVSSVAGAFTPELIANGGRADVPRKLITPFEAISLIREAGGAAVLAHPGIMRASRDAASTVSPELVAQLADAGLAGLEADHPDHPSHVRDRMRVLADQLGLIATGGSDYHGPLSGGARLGTCTTAPEALDRLRAAAG